jgi:hypothetical protein
MLAWSEQPGEWPPDRISSGSVVYRSGSSPPSDLPDTNSTRRIGIRNAAASGFRALARENPQA